MTNRTDSIHSVTDAYQSNRALNALLDSMREIVLYFDQWGVIRHANSSARQWRSGQELTGKTFIEIAPAWDDPAERQREIMQVFRTQTPHLESRERALEIDGDCWFQVDKIPTADEYGRVDGVMVVISDVTHGVRRELAVKESEARYRAYIANSSDAIWRYDICPPIDTRLPQETQIELVLKRAVLAECNERLVRLYGASSASDLMGLPIYHNGSPNIRADVSDFVHNGYRLEDREYERLDNTGQTISLQSSAIGIVESGFLTRVWGTTRDITEKCRYLARMEYLANHDALTSLPNRSVLYRAMNKAIKERADAQKMALLLIDLDRFKEINDTLGHLAGDKVLKQLGQRLQEMLSETKGLVTRLGGDEFAIFLPNLRNAQHAALLAHKLLDSISLVFEVEGLRTEISASIGVAICPDQAQDVSTLMRFADVAMYRAKTGLQGVAVYDSAFDPHSPKRLELMGALGRAIRENQLILHFQPKICLSSNRVYGFEALLRWNHPELGFIPPNDFVPIAEHSNLIYPLTLWVLENGIRHCKHWLQQGFQISMAMNLSARNLLDDRIVLDLKRLLREYDLPGYLVELEITESTIMADPGRAEAALARINRLGVRLSVDDFGTGYSSLAYLKRLPVQTLKIDSSFVRSMLNDEQDEIIVNSTIHLAHNLGLRVVAEGVESPAVYQKLVDLGCDEAQGFYMGRPLPALEAERWLKESVWGLCPT
ncbi:MAG: EAL domain-containing protein [Cellvibrionaceae bacterium]|nr:EAL domain-containing protein [Cellvibrionaceae bacterium]